VSNPSTQIAYFKRNFQGVQTFWTPYFDQNPCCTFLNDKTEKIGKIKKIEDFLIILKNEKSSKKYINI